MLEVTSVTEWQNSETQVFIYALILLIRMLRNDATSKLYNVNITVLGKVGGE
jgi:hypothetical protein